jgi:ACT domain-containing protein
LEELEHSEYDKLKKENTLLLRKINLLRSDLSRFKDNCQSFNEKTEKEIKLMQRIEDLEGTLKEKEALILELKNKNLDLTKEIFQKKEHKKLEEKCNNLQTKLQGKDN